MALEGNLLIGQQPVTGTQANIQAVNPATGEKLEPIYVGGNRAHVEQACELAETAYATYRETSPEERATFLETIASEIEAIGSELIERAMAETGLPQARIEGERGRTCGQLRLFASVVRAGEWLDVRIDPALPDRQPLPRADLRQRHIALGPVAVFGASNFPLAFSVAGGDTASALAAGCPVVVKGHSAHPGTSELVGKAIQKAVKACNLPEGVFSLLFGAGNEIGQALVDDPRIQAVGFTGSRSGGMALMKTAQARPQPIPVYAEMSSINPVFLLPAALKARGKDLGEAFVGSLNMGAGQFCTNPGLVIAVKGPELDAFIEAARGAVEASSAQTMLSPGIHRAYQEGVTSLSGAAGAREIARGQTGSDYQCQTGLFAASASDFLSSNALQAEVFGATSLVVECQDAAEVKRVAEQLEGQLTATLHMDDADLDAAKALMPTLERKAGRILANGWPTGVEVCHAMVHGGPFPATSDSRTTSVGSAAIHRFLRPVCYQSLPEGLLPEALKEGNLLKVSRLVDGKREL
ncbi:MULTISPECIES: aldehyde dehydrogenase (NADP(+)) [unclassified Halomonas]|uniref:aldehyde dehydrogenase (NADP(+)) n=1 Tax=unclassified Halomonas TaxID=2609666 RepID=UPI0007DA2CD9|nr:MULTISPECIES: aldehyde dehydrogenase (NADP(+)) [unclassified Halomonas]MBT2787145.1 aldehyde dehydrogenase (NADP(+)) [Halomonas sp. ISL-106]MBT2795487.1 aldehyde dehydrogenase (NADP(+)) [Halomonas sp. ISL-104]OAL57984.1 2,5-dioxovalerate dehydrogenase [Halomonas sp. ALS9]